jgi:hypothetical protein
MKNDLEKYKCENKERKKSDESFLTFKEKIKLDENNKENNEIENNNINDIDENNLKEKLKEEIEKNEKLQKIIDEQIEQINIYKSKETKARSKFAENHNKNMQDSQNSKKDIPKFLYSFSHIDKFNESNKIVNREEETMKNSIEKENKTNNNEIEKEEDKKEGKKSSKNIEKKVEKKLTLSDYSSSFSKRDESDSNSSKKSSYSGEESSELSGSTIKEEKINSNSNDEKKQTGKFGEKN